jgi:lysophospholipase L1-like esterase
MTLDAPLPSSAEDNTRVLLFQGDSITDTGRARGGSLPNHPHSLGSGYPILVAAQLLGEHPDRKWACYNRGVGGDKVGDLAARWDDDCLALVPDVLSILVGVNDFWYASAGRYAEAAEQYEDQYRRLLDRTREALPEVTLLIGEPFAVSGGSAVDEEWSQNFDHFQAAARRVAEDYGATWIPYQSAFDDALEDAPGPYWAEDGVHPTPAGHYRMAQAWLEAFRNGR